METYGRLYSSAIVLASHAHRYQMGRDGLPYVLHPLWVADKMPTTPEKIVAVLHDVVEDTHVSLQTLRVERFPEEIVEAVDAITKRDGEPYHLYLERVKANKLARAVKIEDLTHNMDLGRLLRVTEKDLERHQKYVNARALLR